MLLFIITVIIQSITYILLSSFNNLVFGQNHISYKNVYIMMSNLLTVRFHLQLFLQEKTE